MMIGFIGGGNMAEALIKGFLAHGHTNIAVAEILEARRNDLASKYTIQTTASNQELVQNSSLIILAVKPQQMDMVLDEIAPAITSDKTVISIAAGITLAHLRKKLPTPHIVRAMPNTPSLVQEGLTALAFDEGFSQQETVNISNLFEAVGTVITINEQQMNAISALSGSGPAFITLFLEMLIQTSQEMGISNEIATKAGLQTIIGTAALLKIGITPQQLRTMVTSPGGSTLEGLKVFEKEGLAQIVAKALQAAHIRASKLGQR